MKLERVLYSFHSFSKGVNYSVSATALLIVTLVYLTAVLSVPLQSPQWLVWLAIYPVIQSEMSGLGYSSVFVKSLWVLPLIVLIGIFNPMIDTAPAFEVEGIVVPKGWVSFVSLTLRGLLAVQAAIILTRTCGFYDMCHSLRHLGCPKILVTQLQFTYRYLFVMIEEALWMDRARKSRGFGRKNYPLAMWGRMVGQLLVRSYDRASAIHRAMLSRGFNGTLPASRSHEMGVRSWLFLFGWTAVIAALRFIDFSRFLTFIIS